jgi:hypothetical protein
MIFITVGSEEPDVPVEPGCLFSQVADFQNLPKPLNLLKDYGVLVVEHGHCL